jgi:hypothetical protein
VRLKRIFQADAISPHGFSLINWRATNRQIRLTRQKVSSNRFGLGGPIDTNVSQRTNAGLVLERALSSNTLSNLQAYDEIVETYEESSKQRRDRRNNKEKSRNFVGSFGRARLSYQKTRRRSEVHD